MFKAFLVAGACVVAFATTAAGAAPLDLSTFTANGSATVTPNLIILTQDVQSQAGSAYAPAQISTNQNFGISFDFAVNTAGSILPFPADGFSFIFQSAGAAALGDSGSGIGAQGIAPSAGVAFKSFVINTSSIFQNGDIYASMNAQSFAIPNASMGHVTVTYDATTNLLSYDASNTTSAAHSSGSATINLASLLGSSAYFGFTGGTGGLSSYQAISNVSVASETAAVPEPASWAMMLVGFGGIGFAIRRRRAKTTVSYT